MNNINNSTVIVGSNNSNININSGKKDLEETKKRLKTEVKDLEKDNLIQLSRLENLIDNAAELFVKIADEYPEMKEFLKEQGKIQSFISQINTLEKVAERKFLYNKKFFEYFELNK